MTNNNNLDALFADEELPLGHPQRRFDDAPEGFDPSPLVDQEPEPDYTPDEDPLRPRRPPTLWRRQYDRDIHRRPCRRRRMRRLPRAGHRGPAGPQRLPRPLPSLPAGDHRPGRGGVAPGRPEALPTLRTPRLVTVRRQGAGCDDHHHLLIPPLRQSRERC